MTDFVKISDEFFDAYNSGDIDAVERALSPTLDFAHNNRGFATQNRAELIAVLRQFVESIMPDRNFATPSRVTALGNVVIREARWTGNPKQDIPGFGAAGEFLDLQLCSVLRFDDDGIIVEWKDYG
ncbi:nuclear transport factor 2 family protein [[Mycobacterium] burgundiense]|uniref:Nuclear transport factor 2 family protein n=1 Tax=[Mycobacterium] burgundiense TaxID=3064286 RepID=A0ABM9LEB6_9MYCO|nr:nuclear transport factor 2 family protein [Mycolicibacterium sp. MU0053]CAJ1497534.1 nuclear transport factor 2 family protein [Mycolicibacterium sp. MU0053]